MTVKSNRINTSVSFAFANIAENSLEVKQGDLLSFTSDGFVTKATPTSVVIGIANDKASFPATNETVEQWRVDYNPVIRENTYKMEVTGDISQVIVGHFYTMDANQKLDVATDSPSVGQFMVQDIYANCVDVRFITNVGLAIPQYEDVRLSAIYPTNPTSDPFDGQYTFELSNGQTVAGDFSDLAWYLGDVTITGNLTVTGDIESQGSIISDQDLTVMGDTNLHDTTVTGDVTITGDTTQTGDVNITGDVTVSGTQNVGELGVTGDAQVVGGLTVLGATALDDTTTDNLTVLGATTLEGTLTVDETTTLTGNVNMGTNLEVAGNTTLQGDLTVNGSSHFVDDVDIDDDLNVDGVLHVGSSATVDHVLTVNEQLVLGTNATAPQFVLEATRNVPNGFAGLNANGQIPDSLLPPLAIGQTFVVSSEAAMLALSAQRGDLCVRTDESKTYIKLNDVNPSQLTDWQVLLSSGEVISVNGQTGAVALDSDDIPDLGCTNQWTTLAEKNTWNAKENSSNKETTTISDSTTLYPSSHAILDKLQNYELVANKDTATLVDSTSHYPSSHVLHDQLLLKQDELVSGTNIKTINGQSLLGAGNIVIQGGGGGSSTYGHYETTGAGVATYTLINSPVSPESFMVYSDSGTAMFPTIDYTYNNNTQTITFNSLGANETAIIWVLSAS